MLRVFGVTDTDFTSNGDIVLQPYKAKVHKEDNGTLAMLLVLVGIVLLLAVDSPNMLILILVKIVGLLFTISGSYMMGEEEND